MHHRILIKVLGDDVESAQSEVEGILENTLRCGECDSSVRDVNWDYVGDIVHVSEEKLQEFRAQEKNPKQRGLFWDKPLWDYDSLEARAEGFKAARQASLETNLHYAEKILTEKFETYFMTREEAPLYMNEDGEDKKRTDRKPPIYGMRAKAILEGSEEEHPYEPPKNFKEMAKVVTKCLGSDSLGMFQYYLRKVEELRECMEFEDADNGLYTLHCLDNHFADMTGETAGENVYYFWCDRHH